MECVGAIVIGRHEPLEVTEHVIESMAPFMSKRSHATRSREIDYLGIWLVVGCGIAFPTRANCKAKFAVKGYVLG